MGVVNPRTISAPVDRIAVALEYGRVGEGFWITAFAMAISHARRIRVVIAARPVHHVLGYHVMEYLTARTGHIGAQAYWGDA